MVKRLDHICLLVRSLDASLPLWEALLGVKGAVGAPSVELGMRQARLRLPEGGLLELTEPVGSAGEIVEALQEQGEGFYHVCFETDDLDAELARAAAAGAAVQEKMARPSPRFKIGFYRTAAKGGVLVELLQRL